MMQLGAEGIFRGQRHLQVDRSGRVRSRDRDGDHTHWNDPAAVVAAHNRSPVPKRCRDWIFGRSPRSSCFRAVGTNRVVGVLSLQGDVVEHLRALEQLLCYCARGEEQSGFGCGGRALIIPGGESTTVIRLLERFTLDAPIVDRVKAGMPLWGTCMGMIVAAREVADLEQKTLDLIDITVRRNAFGGKRPRPKSCWRFRHLDASRFRRSSFARRGLSARARACKR